MEIQNKVANSGLITLEIQKLRPNITVAEIDLAQWLEEGFLLREKPFRAALEEVDWKMYSQMQVALFCSTDAILPSWAFMLLAQKLEPFAFGVFAGSATELRSHLLHQVIENLDPAPYVGQRVIINGCSDPDITPTAFAKLTFRLKPVVKSLMYGEACSTVPIYKN
jgi:hypothetical protein